MAKTVGIGHQDFEQMIINNNFYIDKTSFIKEWWENNDIVTLITRPRRFGKTLNIDMVERFFSVSHPGRDDLFRDLSIWQEEKYRKLQGTYPVISLSFASIKETSFPNTRKKICQVIEKLYNKYDFLLECGYLNEKEEKAYRKISADMEDYLAADSLNALSDYLMRYYRKKVIILLDEYDTPMQEAYVHGYWDELVSFTRSLFNAAFKTNPYLERAIMTGVTRVSKESIFSDLNNLEVVTTTSEKYETSFGFTQEEVWEALKEYGLYENRKQVQAWYDGFTFGTKTDIYNPWSIINYLSKRKFSPYWANTSSNSLVGELIRQGSPDIKIAVEDLLNDRPIVTSLDEEVVFSQLDDSDEAVFSLLLSSGYLRIKDFSENEEEPLYTLSLTNLEVKKEFRKIIGRWFKNTSVRYNDFIKALFANDVNYMNQYMNQITQTVFSFFDTGNHPSEESQPERFYHGFVLGLMVDSGIHYTITSNRESDLGRYDIIMEPKNIHASAYILEFKVYNPKKEYSLEDTVKAAHAQIDRKKYDFALLAKGIPKDKIHLTVLHFEEKKF